MNCARIRALFSSFLDDAVSSAEMQLIRAHLERCPACRVEYLGLSRTQELVASLGKESAPADLALRLHVALSRASSESLRNRWEGVRVRWANALEEFMLPATAGVVSAVLFFALLIGYIAIPQKVEASTGDETPLMLYSPPQLNSSPFITTVGNLDGSLVVETYVDANGRVADYRIISAPEGTEKLIPQLDNLLIFTTFRPAMNLGRPRAGWVMLSFSGVNVRG